MRYWHRSLLPKRIVTGTLSLFLVFGTAACEQSATEEAVQDNTTHIETKVEESVVEIVSVAFPSEAVEETFPMRLQVRNLTREQMDAVCITCKLLDKEGRELQALPVVSGSIEAKGDTWIDTNVILTVEGKEVKTIKVTGYDILDRNSDEEDGYTSLGTGEFSSPRVITPDMVPINHQETDLEKKMGEGQE